MFGSTVSGAASGLGLEFKSTVNSTEVRDCAEAGIPILLLADIGLPGLDLSELATALPPSTLDDAVAYGPHVHREKLDLARSSGFGQVLSRGQFSSLLPGILASWAKTKTSDR